MTSMATPAPSSVYYLRDSYELSFAVSIFLHTLLLLLLFYGWNYRSKDLEVVTSQYVQARLVKMTAQSVVTKQEPVKEVIEKPLPKAEAEPVIIRPLQREVVQTPKESKNQLQQKKLKEEKLKQEKLKQEQEQLEKQKQAQAEQAAKEKAEAEKRKADQALAKAMADEDAQKQLSADKALAESYVDRIRRHAEQNWNRPLSAQKGMEVLLEIQLVPTGYVNSVSVLKSSGNPAFDQSALQAVHKADPFSEIKDVPSRVFEQYFRRFTMAFKQQDNF